MCHKNLCNCVEYRVEYEYGAKILYCYECYIKEDELTNLYKYFSLKYNETL